MSNKTEEVLCISTELLKELGINLNKVGLQVVELTDVWVSDLQMHPRNVVDDPNNVAAASVHPQILVYCSLWKYGKVAIYQRKGTEKRLDSKWSIGFGGHIETEDIYPTLVDTLDTALLREIKEETGYTVMAKDITCSNQLIVDTRDDVGKVHVGVYYKATITDETIQSTERELDEITFIDPALLISYVLEGWSQLVMEQM